jgi:hypothetical protein
MADKETPEQDFFLASSELVKNSESIINIDGIRIEIGKLYEFFECYKLSTLGNGGLELPLVNVARHCYKTKCRVGEDMGCNKCLTEAQRDADLAICKPKVAALEAKQKEIDELMAFIRRHILWCS